MVARQGAAPSSAAPASTGSDLVASEVMIIGPESPAARIDELSQQLLGARDAALGAEIELGVARARVAELERQVHLLEVEIAELRKRCDSSLRDGLTSALTGGGDRRDGDPGRIDLTLDLARSSASRVGRRLRRAIDS